MVMPITIYRWSHDPELVNEKVVGIFKNCDVFFIEEGASNEHRKLEKIFSEASRTGLNDDYIFLSEDSKRLMSLVENSGKIIEVEKSALSIRERNEILEMGLEAASLFLDGKYEESCKKRLEHAKRYCERTIRDRDNDMKEQLANIQAENEGKNILAPIGSLHQVYRMLKNDGLDVKQVLSRNPIVPGIFGEVTKRIYFGKPVPKELMPQSIVQNLIGTYFFNFYGKGMVDSNLESRKIAERLSYEELRELSEYLDQKTDRKGMPVEATVVWLKKKGIEI
jgi:hypothetical protein